jgi:hypothetical protein
LKIEDIDIEATIEKVRQLVSDDEQLSAASKSMFEILILIITLLANPALPSFDISPCKYQYQKLQTRQASGQKLLQN